MLTVIPVPLFLAFNTSHAAWVMFTSTMSLADVNKETLTACSGNLCSSSFSDGEVFVSGKKQKSVWCLYSRFHSSSLRCGKSFSPPAINAWWEGTLFTVMDCLWLNRWESLKSCNSQYCCRWGDSTIWGCLVFALIVNVCHLINLFRYGRTSWTLKLPRLNGGLSNDTRYSHNSKRTHL